MTIRSIADKFRIGEIGETNPGERMRQTYKLVNVDGVKSLEPDDFYDLQEEINSFEPSVNFNNIIERFTKGDLSVLSKAEGFYADVSKMPKNFMEAVDINNKGMAAFDSLPAKVKELYDNNYINFINHPEILNDYIEKNYMERAKAETNVSDVKSESEKNEA